MKWLAAILLAGGVGLWGLAPDSGGAPVAPASKSGAVGGWDTRDSRSGAGRPWRLPMGQAQRDFQRLAADARQHLLVVTDAPDEIHGRLFRMAFSAGADSVVGEAPWRQVGDPIPVVVGRGGVGPKVEGDGRSPEGVFPLGLAFGYASGSPPGVRLPYEPMAQASVCVDDPGSRFYNRVFDAELLPEETARDWGSAESMRRDLAYGDDLYRWGVVVDYNVPPVAGRGSCIFLHVWRGPDSPTSGCTAMKEDDLLTVMGWLDPAADPVLVQGDRSYLEGLARDGVLPYGIPPG